MKLVTLWKLLPERKHVLICLDPDYLEEVNLTNMDVAVITFRETFRIDSGSVELIKKSIPDNI